jgi:hypothetical protein
MVNEEDSSEGLMKRGIIAGLALGFILIVTQPFYPVKGLIPELASFLATVPLWVGAILFHQNATPLTEGGVILIYFFAIGLMLGAAFERKRIWGWLLFLTLIICHYAVYNEFNRQMGEVLQSFINLFA